MIIYNIRKLENKLISDKVSDKEALNYLIANLLLWTICTCLGSEQSFQLKEFLELLVLGAILIYACKECYKINRSGDNKDFLKRFLALYFVLSIRLLGLLLFFGMIFIIFFQLINSYEFLNGEYFDWILDFLTIVIEVLFYNLLIRSFKRLQKGTLARGDVDTSHILDYPV